MDFAKPYWLVGGMNKEYCIQKQSQFCIHGAKDSTRRILLLSTANATGNSGHTNETAGTVHSQKTWSDLSYMHAPTTRMMIPKRRRARHVPMEGVDRDMPNSSSSMEQWRPWPWL
jgi:hypothetical protein